MQWELNTTKLSREITPLIRPHFHWLRMVNIDIEDSLIHLAELKLLLLTDLNI
jgi:hypothetical protein